MSMEKRMKLFDKKIGQFPEIVDWAKRIDVTESATFLVNNKGNLLFLASGWLL